MTKSLLDKGGGDLSPNLTSLIDVTFNIVLFFMLTGTMASQELAQVALVEPHKSQAIPYESMPPNRVVVNVVSASPLDEGVTALSGTVKEYQVGQRKISAGDRDGLVRALKERRDKVKGEFFIEIRGDQRVSYGQVEPVLLAAAEANIPKVNITALVALGEE